MFEFHSNKKQNKMMHETLHSWHHVSLTYVIVTLLYLFGTNLCMSTELTHKFLIVWLSMFYETCRVCVKCTWLFAKKIPDVQTFVVLETTESSIFIKKNQFHCINVISVTTLGSSFKLHSLNIFRIYGFFYQLFIFIYFFSHDT